MPGVLLFLTATVHAVMVIPLQSFMARAQGPQGLLLMTGHHLWPLFGICQCYLL